MNNKLVISTLLAVLSGCSTTHTLPVMIGTGAGSSGTGQKSNTQAVSPNSYPPYANTPSFPSKVVENSVHSAVVSKPAPSRYPSDRSGIQAVKSHAKEETAFENAAVSSKTMRVEVIRTNSNDKVYLQLGVFSNLDNAKMLQKKVAANQMPEPIIKEVILNGKLAHRVQLGPIVSTAKVNEFNAKLAKIGISETWYVTESKP